MLASIESFHQRLPGATFKLASGVDEHHGMLRFLWTMFGADGRPLVEGFDIGELDSDGRLKRMTGFSGRSPHQPPRGTASSSISGSDRPSERGSMISQHIGLPPVAHQ